MTSNSSGIHPTGSLVLVLMDQVATHHGGIALTDESITAQQVAQIRGTLLEIGPRAWEEERYGTGPGQHPNIAARVICRRYAGELVTGMDNLFRYRVMNDKDIWAIFDEAPVNQQGDKQ